MKTDKYNNMLEAFECDFTLALMGRRILTELEKHIADKDERLIKDIKLLHELSYLLRNGKAEIHLVEEAK
jgi:hypothetical protein